MIFICRLLFNFQMNYSLSYLEMSDQNQILAQQSKYIEFYEKMFKI